jgi:hypothetical protein
VNGYEIRARRHAREIVDDMHWRGMTVPPIYAEMAQEFQDLVRSGEYSAWVAANQKTTKTAVGHGLDDVGKPAPPASLTTVTPPVRARPALAGRVALRRHLLTGPA